MPLNNGRGGAAPPSPRHFCQNSTLGRSGRASGGLPSRYRRNQCRYGKSTRRNFAEPSDYLVDGSKFWTRVRNRDRFGSQSDGALLWCLVSRRRQDGQHFVLRIIDDKRSPKDAADAPRCCQNSVRTSRHHYLCSRSPLLHTLAGLLCHFESHKLPYCLLMMTNFPKQPSNQDQIPKKEALEASQNMPVMLTPSGLPTSL